MVLGGALLCSGCGKSKPAAQAQDYNGVEVDLPKLKQAFASAGPDLVRLADEVGFGLRYGDYAKSLQALDQITNNPSCTEDQKRLAVVTMGQIGKLAEKNAAQQ